MRRFLIAGNWKMHGSQNMTTELIAGITDGLKSFSENELPIDVLVCPPNPYLSAAQNALTNSPINLGAQNVNAHPKGAFTGETSLAMLNEFACGYVLLGHSERRELFAETDEQVAEKFAACVTSEHGVTPVLCLGETLSQRQAGDTETIVGQQLDAVIKVAGIGAFAKAVIAYEPVWAIGTGETASPEQAQQVHAFIRQKLAQLDSAIAEKVQILYGGSMKPSNAPELLAQADIDGGLIGGAALEVDSFIGICEAANKLAK